MHNSGVRPSVRVIRLVQGESAEATPAPVRVKSTLVWPAPIGSGPATRRPAPPSPEAGKRQELARLSGGRVETWPITCRAEGREYARQWWWDACLTLLTLGLYLPWAQVRSRRYFLRRTVVAGHAMDYHEPVTQAWPRHALALGLVLGVSGAWAGSALAGMLALSLALAVWPMLVLTNLTHRLAQVSWAGRRLAFDAAWQEVYRALWWPLASGGALAWLAMAATLVGLPTGWRAWGGVALLWLLCWPIFLWSWFRFRQQHLRLGPLSLLWKARREALFLLTWRVLTWAMLASLFSAGLGAILVAGVLGLEGRLTWTSQGVIAAVSGLVVAAAVLPYAQARLQNLVWSKTGNRYVRFRSRLSPSGHVARQLRHLVWLLCTAGLAWPWVAVANHRRRLEAMTIWARVDVEVLQAAWPVHTVAVRQSSRQR